MADEMTGPFRRGRTWRVLAVLVMYLYSPWVRGCEIQSVHLALRVYKTNPFTLRIWQCVLLYKDCIWNQREWSHRNHLASCRLISVWFFCSRMHVLVFCVCACLDQRTFMHPTYGTQDAVVSWRSLRVMFLQRRMDPSITYELMCSIRIYIFYIQVGRQLLVWEEMRKQSRNRKKHHVMEA